LAVLLLALSSCDGGGGGGPSFVQTAEPGESAAGTALEYHYSFLLDDDRIAAAQERHASNCEALGRERCRIVGLRYSVDENDRVSAMLKVTLEPSIARRFGKAISTDVTNANGKLVTSEFTGEDVGTSLGQSEQRQKALTSRIADLQQRLAAAPAGGNERAELQRQLTESQKELETEKSTASASEHRLTSTPMTFDYYGQGGLPGFGKTNPFADAAKLAAHSFVTMVRGLLNVIAVILPWAVLLLLVLLVWRSRPMVPVRRWASAFLLLRRRPDNS
jgi:hypothetical protein